MLVLLCVAGAEPAKAAPTVSLVASGPRIGAIYFAGDSFTLTVHGPAFQSVTVSQTRGSLMLPAVVWQTDVNGNFSIPGAWTIADVGSYTQTWYVGGVAASPVLSFQVAALPTVSLTVTGTHTGTAYEVGNTYTVAVTGPSGQPVTVQQNGSMSGQLGTTAGGTWSPSATWGYDAIGTYTQTWYVDGIPATPTLPFSVVAPHARITTDAGNARATLWYFNGQSNAGFPIAASLVLVQPTPSDPNANIVWSTDNPSLISLIVTAGHMSATITTTGASAPQQYDVNVFVTYDGTKSPAFPVHIQRFRNVPSPHPVGR